MRLKIHLAALTALGVLNICVVTNAQPAGWVVAGSAPHEYEFGFDATAEPGTRESAAAFIKSLVPQHSGFGTLAQNSSSERYAGKRVALSGWMRTSAVGRAQMWLRIDDADRKPVAFDNMSKRPVTGTTAWTRYEIVLDVPAAAENIVFGFLLFGGGMLWADDFSLELLDSAVQ